MEINKQLHFESVYDLIVGALKQIPRLQYLLMTYCLV